MINAIEVTQSEFETLEGEITNLLKPYRKFTSSRCQAHAIPTVNGKVLLIKPKQDVFVDAIKSLNIDWVEFDKDIILNNGE